MIQIKKPKYEHDNYCACCRKPFEDSMQISFSHKDYKDSVSITLCGKCREELRKALGKDIDVPGKSALDHIHNVVRDDAYKRGYDDGKKDAIPMDWIHSYIDRLKAMGVVISIRDAQAVSVMVDKYMMEQNGNATCGPDYCEIGGTHDE